MSAAGPPQGAKGAPFGGSAAAEPQAWGGHTSTFREVIDRHAVAQPGAAFLLAPEAAVEIDYTTLQATCIAFAALLESRGVAPGATVSFMLENGASAATVFLGAMYGGYVVSPINLHAQDAQLEYTLAHSDTRIVFTSAGNRERLERAPGERRRFDICVAVPTASNCPMRHRRASHRAGRTTRQC